MRTCYVFSFHVAAIAGNTSEASEVKGWGTRVAGGGTT